MKRVLLGLLLGALIFAGAVGAKVVTVTNPMSADLDAAQHNITGVQALYASNVFSTGEIVAGQPGGNGVLQLSDTQFVNGPAVMAGTADPSVEPQDSVPAGSLYLRSNGQWWLKTSSFSVTAWSCEIGCTP